jgi:hypothetical protein
MPQHLWTNTQHFRLCGVCRAWQLPVNGNWSPPIGPICPGDDDEEDGSDAAGRRRPNAPSGSPRVLEDA